MTLTETPAKKSVAVIGGGISGLAAAYYLQQASSEIEVHLFEASHRLGGVIETSHDHSSTIELGADNFATLIPHARELSHEVGIDGDLIHPNQDHRFAKIVHRGKVQPIPDGFSLMQPTRVASILTTPTLSLAGKLRLLYEPWITKRTEVGDESLEAFTIRRLGREAYDRLVEPIIGGIFTADGRTLSMQAALPQFIVMEKQHGSLMRAFWAQRKIKSAESRSASKASGARYDQFVTHRDGMSAWLRSIQDKLPFDRIHLRTRVDKISPRLSAVSIDDSSADVNSSRSTPIDNDLAAYQRSHGWLVHFQSEDSSTSPMSQEFDAVIVACPASPAASILRELRPKISEVIRTIPYADSAVVAMIIDRQEVDPKHFCFGIVVPKVEGLNVLAISFTSEKYPHRVPPGKLLLRVFLGGAAHPDILDQTDSQLFDLAWNDTRKLLHLKTRPEWSRIIRWKAAMPQYLVGHNQRLESLMEEVKAYPTLALAGNAYAGVGIPQCVRSGRQAAQRIASLWTGIQRAQAIS